MSDIVARLRRPVTRVNAEVALLCEAALAGADEIEALRAALAKRQEVEAADIAEMARLRSDLEALRNDATPRMPEGWALYSADFSLNADEPLRLGRVMLRRTGRAYHAWHALPEPEKETVDLYVSGTGHDLAEAMHNAIRAATDAEMVKGK